ncbi:uncharacterized protein LOC132032016 [Lycium ferocissimum]|uniref:uncharacterized protein LOC132032016 n=1 Tax=Lycium ferocissimum TaxID=112874 RepID=UPI0028167005|nr:uncharacterized protein LOC132032016 [Lycium ferocissimum]
MSENHCFANRTLPPAVVFYLNQQHQQISQVPRLAKPSLSVDYFMSCFSFEDQEFIEEEEEEEEEFANDVSESILDDEEIIEEEEEEEEEFEVEISENSETIRTRMEFAHSMDIDQQHPPHIPSGTIDEVQPTRARAPRMRAINNYVRHTFQVPQYSILDSDTYGYDVNEGDPVVGDEEQETCAICFFEYKDEDTIGTLQCGHEFHVGCIKKWLQRKKECPFCRAPVLPTL